MTIPSASVKIDFVGLLGLPYDPLDQDDFQYARATVKIDKQFVYRSGRSRPIPTDDGDHDLTSELEPWCCVVDLEPNQKIKIEIKVYEDLGDKLGGERHTISGAIADPWAGGRRRFGSNPSFEVEIETTMVNPVDDGLLARAKSESGISGTLVVRQLFALEIVDINGLFKPSTKNPVPLPAASRHLGYLSDDNQGRIFVNRIPDGTWTKSTQYIDVDLKITGLGGIKIPAGAKIKWMIVDNDDPLNESRHFHREAGRYVDPNDYDDNGNPVGANPNDNADAFSPGNTDVLKLFGAAVKGSGKARWARKPGGPTVRGISLSEAETEIEGVGKSEGASVVRIHCPNVLGTNMILKAELIGVPEEIEVHNASTGLMTMWRRIDVEYVRMENAFPLIGALRKIPKIFSPACVQLDFHNEREVKRRHDKEYMARSEKLIDRSTQAWINRRKVFSHSGEPGWFFLGAANRPYPLASGISHPALYSGSDYNLGKTGNRIWVEVPKKLIKRRKFKHRTTEPAAVLFSWKHTDVDGNKKEVTVMFGVMAAETITAGNAVDKYGNPIVKTKITLIPDDLTPTFSGYDEEGEYGTADGSQDHAYKNKMLVFPQDQVNPGTDMFSPGGFGIPKRDETIDTTIQVFQPSESGEIGGISPSTHIKNGMGKEKKITEYFAGRTVVFTRISTRVAYSPPEPVLEFDDDVAGTIAHEFIHAFGMPHKCGQWDWRTPRDKSCCMNYHYSWLVDSNNNLIPGHDGKVGNDLCARHLMEIRRVHLENNPALNW